MQDEPALPEPPQRLPTRELLLAQALEACITAERHAAGSAQAIIDQQPAWLRADLQSMMTLVGSLDSAAASASMSPEFRQAARARLMEHIGADAALEPAMFGPRLSAVSSRNGHYPGTRRRSTWLWRGSAGLLAAVLGATATLTASASALPGEPLYDLKQAQEELSVRLAPDDQARALALLGRADARLDETARLLPQGRTSAALETTQRYGQSVERATTTYIITMSDTPEPGTGPLTLETRLTQQQEQLQTLLQSAPELARADLREALVTTERGRALVADPRPVERALGRASRDKSAVAAEAVPTMAAEDSPTAVPTRRPAGVPQPPAPVVVAQANEEPAPETLVAQHEGTSRSGDSGNARLQNASPDDGGRATQPVKLVANQNNGDDGPNSPTVVAHDEGGSSSDRGSDGPARSGPTAARGGSGSAPAQSERPVVAQQPNKGKASGSEADAARGHGDEAAQPVIAHGRNDDGAQPSVAQGRSDDGAQTSIAQTRNDDGPQPTIARQPATSASARDSGAANDNKTSGATANNAYANGGNGNDRTGNGGTAARNGPPQVASPGDKPNSNGRDTGDSHTTAPAGNAAKPQPTPTPSANRHGDAGGDANPRPTPVPGRNPPPDQHGGGDNGHPGDGGGDNGHPGD